MGNTFFSLVIKPEPSIVKAIVSLLINPENTIKKFVYTEKAMIIYSTDPIYIKFDNIVIRKEDWKEIYNIPELFFDSFDKL